jgi:MoaA/NifB/PqqE/SkfB family radical SAM enzyme
MQTNLNNIVGFHIEPTNMCTLKCPGCARTRFIDQWPKQWKNYNINIDHLIEFLDISLENKSISFCGNYGDPIYHPDLFLLVSELKLKGASIKITTNGSYKNEKWWEDLVSLLDEKDHIQFSVDGVPDNFKNYRVNADWKTIEPAMKVVANAKCHSSWKYIVFSYNQTTIDQAKEMSELFGIDQFIVTYSDRYDFKTDHLKPSEEFVNPRFYVHENFKNAIKVADVDPLCQKNNQHYISADGFYSPCCYVSDYRFYYKTEFGKNKKKYSISNSKLTEILAQESVVNFYNNLKDQPVCQFNCPLIS